MCQIVIGLRRQAAEIPEENQSGSVRKGGPPVGHVQSWRKVCNAYAEGLC